MGTRKVKRMKYEEVKGDLFEVNSNLAEGEQPYSLAHCISLDFGMFGGIAAQFNSVFDMKNLLLKKYPAGILSFISGTTVLPVTVEDPVCGQNIVVYNLVTKKKVSDKPTYEAMESVLGQLRELTYVGDIKRLAIPMIGCGIDGLEWDKVKELIHKVFDTSDIEIKVCLIGEPNV